VGGRISSDLQAVTAISGDNAWAAGNSLNANGTYRTITLHWDGRTWTAVPSQTPGGNDQFHAVTASWTHNIWAIGIRSASLSCGEDKPCQTLIEHWYGSRWTLVASPDPPNGHGNVLFGISAVSSTDIWAVGTTGYESTLIIHWNGKAWS
jgi:hypothetical protein